MEFANEIHTYFSLCTPYIFSFVKGLYDLFVIIKTNTQFCITMKTIIILISSSELYLSKLHNIMDFQCIMEIYRVISQAIMTGKRFRLD